MPVTRRSVPCRRPLAAPLLIGLLALMPVLAGCGAGVLPSVRSESERLALAERLAQKREYGTAIELLKVFIASNGGSADVDNAIYLLGDCYLKTKVWGSASLEFERLLRDFPESDSGAAASFRLAESYYGQSRSPDFDQEFTVKSEEQWQSYLRDNPGHWLNPEARRRILLAHVRLATKLTHTGNLYLKMHQLKPARSYFERVEREYPDTPLLADAWVGMAKCDEREGRKAAAVERLKQVESQFAGRPVAERAARERARLQN